METIRIQYYRSPYGELMLGSLGDKLCLCDWISEKRKEKIGRRMRNTLHAVYEEGASEVIAMAIIQLDEYFARKRTEFDMPLRENGVLRRAVPKVGQPEGRTGCSGCQWGECPLHIHSLPSCGGQQPSTDRLCRWTGSKTRAAGIGSRLLRWIAEFSCSTAVLRSDLFLVFCRCHPRHAFEELREERRIGKVQFV